jgi:gamma-glutamylcyclotransferase (GGCT)/AIG2-like uncharacterized protein YtfP
MIANLANLVTIASIAGVGFIAYQIRLQARKNKLELILKLSNDFYNNDKLQVVFEYLDQDKKSISEINKELENLIWQGIEIKIPDDNTIIKEIHFNIYLNFFNSIAVLVDENVVKKELAMQLFNYQLEKTFAYPAMIKYMEDYNFVKIKLLLPDTIFTYGTLSDPSQRKSIPELENCASSLSNGESIRLKNYELVDVEADQIYKGMVPSKKGTHVLGTLVAIKEKSSWFELFSSLDLYEEVDTLYDRKIIQLNDSKQYVWTYMKKENK